MASSGSVPDAAAPPPGLPGIAQKQNVAAGDPPLTDILAQGALDVLATYCGACHANGVAEGGFGDVLDVAKLIEGGQVVPSSSATSPLMVRMLDASMPHPAVPERPTRGEISLVQRFIDELSALPTAPCDALPFHSHDDLYATLSADISTRPAAERRFVRYLGLTYASNARLCGPALETQRHALFKLLNSVSTGAEVHVPEAIDDNGLLYRIDLRSYGWNREIDLEDDGVVDFADGWLAIVSGVGPYATEYQGPEADVVKGEALAEVPFLSANAFVQASTVGDLYYALIGARGTVDDTLAALGIDRRAAEADNDLQRAGLAHASLTSHETAVVRLRQTAFQSRFVWLLEEQDLSNAASIYEYPLDPGHESQQIIFNLPNGMQAYSLGDARGQRLSELPIGCVGSCSDPRKVNAVACQGCHSTGLIPITDVVRGYAEANASSYDFESLADILVQYPEQAALDELIAQDSELHVRAVESAGVPRNAPEPISRVFLQFQLDGLDLDRAASELGVTRDALLENLGRLDPRFSALAAPNGTVDRAVFAEALRSSLCALHANARNPPTRCP